MTDPWIQRYEDERSQDLHDDLQRALERQDRAREQASLIHEGPLERCRECHQLPVEVRPSHWACACQGWAA